MKKFYVEILSKQSIHDNIKFKANVKQTRNWVIFFYHQENWSIFFISHFNHLISTLIIWKDTQGIIYINFLFQYLSITIFMKHSLIP